MGNPFLRLLPFLAFFLLLIFFMLGDAYQNLHHADNLYLPLLIKDLKNGVSIHSWYYPPSPYFFPDACIIYILSLFLGDEWILLCFGLVNISIILFVFYHFYHSKGKCNAYKILLIFITGQTLSLLIANLFSKKIEPIVYLLLNGHHTSVIYLSIFLFLFLNKKNLNFLFKVLIFVVFVMAYVSDRFFIIGILAVLLSQWGKRNHSRIKHSFFLILILIFGEILYQGLSGTINLPSHFHLLPLRLADRTIFENLYFFLVYYYDFLKIFIFEVSFSFLLFFFSSLIFVLCFKNKLTKQDRYLLAGLFILSLGFLGIIGRYIYPHPFPFRYMIPSVVFLLFYGVFLFLKITKFNPVSSSYLIALLVLQGITILFIAPDSISNYREKQQRQIQILRHLEHTTKDKIIWTNYESANKIRFYSKDHLRPRPLDNSGYFYPWITRKNEDLHPTTMLPLPNEIIWIPNSLTKDF
ncbi:MAG: hypothetical protein SH817_13560 [Leptospira sp.]|nr:hypothetical protein [Leptospira sp.]